MNNENSTYQKQFVDTLPYLHKDPEKKDLKEILIKAIQLPISIYKELEKLIKNAIAKRAVLAVLQALAIVAALTALVVFATGAGLIMHAQPQVALVVLGVLISEVLAVAIAAVINHYRISSSSTSNLRNSTVEVEAAVEAALAVLLAGVVGIVVLQEVRIPGTLVLAAMIASIVAAVVGVAIAKVIKHYCISSSVGVGVAAGVAVKIVGGTGGVVGVVGVVAVVGVIVGVVIAEAIAHYCINSSPVSNLRDLTPGINNESAHEVY